MSFCIKGTLEFLAERTMIVREYDIIIKLYNLTLYSLQTT